MIRVGLDVQIAMTSRAGIGQFTAALSAWLPRVDREAEYVELLPSRAGDLNMPWRWWWDQVGVPRLARRERCQVVLKPGFSVPVRSRVPTVAVLHDLAARRFPEQLHRPSAWFYGRWAPWTLRFAARVLVISSFTADEAASLLGLPRERMTVITQGGDPEAKPDSQPSDAAVARRFRLPSRFLLHVGTIEPRKNLAFLVRAFGVYHRLHPDVGLVLAGAEGWLSHDVRQAVERARLGSAVQFLGSVDDDARRSLYRLATALVFPSFYEGFGRPPLEAMASGLPVVAAAAASIPEVVGRAGILVSGYDERVWATAMAKVTDDAALRSRLRSDGLDRARKFTWEQSARQVAAVLHEVAHG